MIGDLQRMLERVRAVFRQDADDQEFDAEAASHIQLAVDENMRRGLSEDDARRQALIRFGGVAQAKEHHRDARALPFVDVAIQDLRYAARLLRREPGFTFVAVAMLGLGIGANAAVFSIVNTLLLRPLPFESPQQLVWIQQTNAKSGLSSMTYSVDAYEEFRARNRSFQDVTAYFPFYPPENDRLGGHGSPLPITAMSVLGNFFRVLGVQPAIGRAFVDAEATRGGRAAVVLSYPFWQRQFAGDPRIVGRVIDLNGQPVMVVGVLPAGFDFGAVFSPGLRVDAFVPIIPDEMRDWGNTLLLIGRLRPGVSIERADVEARSIAPELYFNVKFSRSRGGYTMRVSGLKEHVTGQLRRSLLVLWCAVGFTLLIVCVNLANLLIARNGARAKELAMRSALGAERGRLVRQLLTESVLLSAGGVLVGVVVAAVVMRYLAHQGSVQLPLLSSARLDGVALAWTLVVAVVSSLAFGLVPAMKLSVTDLQSTLKDESHGSSAGLGHHRLRSVLVVSEIALACVLLVGAGLLLRSFLRVLDVDLGFRPVGVSAIKVDFDDGGSAERRAAIFNEMLQRIGAIPGIQSSGITDNLPLEGNRSWGLSAKGKQYREGELQGSFVYMISPGYLETMGVRLEKGRSFTWADAAGSPPVVIINAAAARYLWPGVDPVGQTALINGRDVRVVGVAADVHETSLEKTGAWQMYLPATQAGPNGAILTIRSALPAKVLASSVMKVLRSLNPAQPATQLRLIQTSVDHAISPRRFFMILVGSFAAFGLILAALGVYGVISYSVTQRTQEIGIRMALGASASQVQRGIVWQTMRLVIIGLAIGMTAAFALSRLIASMLFETAPTDAGAFTATVILLACSAAAAAALPAYRAARVDPMRALRPM
jgi:predicted permease